VITDQKQTSQNRHNSDKSDDMPATGVLNMIEEIFYSLGQLSRCIYPDGDVPDAILDVILSQPASGLRLLMRTQQAKAAPREEIERLMDKIPRDLADPEEDVKTEDTMPYWLGYYHYAATLGWANHFGAAQLRRVGEFLFGKCWQTDLARALDVGDRSVRAWLSGGRRIPPGIWVDIFVLLRKHEAEGYALMGELDR
jgi:hypothetical protein